jgi:hypothetical protein
VIQRRAGEKIPEAAEGAPAGNFLDAVGESRTEGRGSGASGRATFSAPGEAPAGVADKAQQEAQAGGKAPASMVIAIRLSGQEGELAQFEKLLSHAQGAPQGQQGQKADRQEDGAARSQAEQQSALRQEPSGQRPAPVPGRELAKGEGGAGGREDAKRVPAAVHVYDAHLSHDALIELLAQLRSRPGSYQLESLPNELAQDDKRRTGDSADEIAAEQLKNSIGRDADLKEEQDVRHKASAEEKSSSPPVVVAPAKTAASAAPRLYHVQIVLRQGSSAIDPPAARVIDAEIQKK